MLSFLTNRFNPINQKDFYPNPRSEGRVKSYDSCSDFRAWSLHDQDLHDYLVYIIKLNDVDPYGFLSKRTIFELLSALFGGKTSPAVGEASGTARLAELTPAPDEDLTGRGDKCAEEMTRKDEEIDRLRNELDDWERRYNELLSRIPPDQLEDLPKVDNSCADKDKLIAELMSKLNETQQDKARLSDHNAELVRNVDRFSEHIETLSELKDRISEYAECGQLLFGNNDRYKQLLEETLKAVVGREQMCSNKELKKERKKYEDQIKEQLSRMLEMYEHAINCLKEKDEELQKRTADLENMKLENELMASRCICGGDERRDEEMVGMELGYGDEDNASIATIEDIQISTSAPIISIEMTQCVNHHRSRNNSGTRDNRVLNTSQSEQRIYEESSDRSVTRRHRVFAHTRHCTVVSSRGPAGNPNEYTVQGNPSIEFRIPFVSYTFVLKPDQC